MGRTLQTSALTLQPASQPEGQHRCPARQFHANMNQRGLSFQAETAPQSSEPSLLLPSLIFLSWANPVLYSVLSLEIPPTF